MKLKSLAFFLAVMVGASSTAIALNPRKTINQYGHNIWLRQNGLPGNAVNVGLQTYDGYLWFGMAAGLFRFDGETFDRVSTIPDDNTNNESVTALCETSDSSLWIGTAYNQVCRIQQGKIFRYGEAEGVNSRNVNALLRTRSGTLWLGTSYGLYRFDNGKFINVPITPSYITGLAEDAKGRLWVGTHAGVRIFVGDRQVEARSIIIDGKPQLTTTLFADREENIWIGTYGGLVRWHNGTMITFTAGDGLSDGHVTALCEDRDKNIWVGTNGGGIVRYANGRWRAFTAADGLSNNHVLSIIEDYEGSVWVCTLDGLNRFMDVNVTPYTTKEGLVSDFISGVAETPDGSIYMLSDESLSVVRLKDGKLTRISVPVGPAFVSRDGSLWVGQTGALTRIKDDEITRYDATTGLPNKWITAISEDSESLILYVLSFGICRFVDGKYLPYELKKGEPYVSNEYVSCFHPEPGGALWIGTSRGLVRIRNGQVKTFGPPDGMADYWVNYIFDDGHGSILIGSPHGGLTRFRDGNFTAYNAKVGLFTDELYCVLGDDQGDLWLSSPRGIGHVTRRELDDYEARRISAIHTQVFMTADGMKTDECFGQWQPAGWKAHDGRLWFATKKGAVVIDPKKLIRNETPPPIFMKEVIADLRSIPITGSTRLSPETENFEFHYAALSYLVPERVRFKYMLEGYDRDFVDAGTRRVAYYTNLPPGNYRFRVMASNNDGVWNKTGAAFSFSLEPHFYQTYWFYALMLMGISGIAFGSYRLRVWQLLKKEEELELRVQEALNSAKVLGGLIPICSSCKKIRNDKGYWDLLEAYIQSHSEAKFSHGLCPECANKLYPEIFPGSDESAELPGTSARQ